MKVYVASSWRNFLQPSVVLALREAKHEVYDFKNPGPGQKGFAWREVSPNWEHWTPEEYIEAMKHPLSIAGFKSDIDAINWADACVMVQPCGRSSALELGYAAGKGKVTIAFLAPGQEPELMLKMCNLFCTSVEQVVAALAYFDKP